MEASPYARGITSGVYNFVRWLGAAIAPILSGAIGDLYTPHTPFMISGIVAVVGFLIMLIPVKYVKEALAVSPEPQPAASSERQAVERGAAQPRPGLAFESRVLYRAIVRPHRDAVRETNVLHREVKKSDPPETK